MQNINKTDDKKWTYIQADRHKFIGPLRSVGSIMAMKFNEL